MQRLQFALLCSRVTGIHWSFRSLCNHQVRRRPVADVPSYSYKVRQTVQLRHQILRNTWSWERTEQEDHLRYGSFSTYYIEVNLSVFSVLPVDRLAGELGALLHFWLMALTVIWYCWPQSSSDRKPLVMLVLNASVFPFPLTASTAYVSAPALEAQLRVPSPVPQSRMGVKAWGTHGAKEPENRTALKLSWGLCLLA